MVDGPVTVKNPTSPKVIWAGIGGLLGQVGWVILQAILDALNTDQGQTVLDTLPAWAKLIAQTLVVLAGVVIGGRRATDPLRLPTLDQEAVDALNAAD